ncbi:hypothetical protein A2U01_0051475, partial [Trifolium medium]|nr:hypothetical protein [Trifolium medium]
LGSVLQRFEVVFGSSLGKVPPEIVVMRVI